MIDYLIDLARRSRHRLMIRLVKGAYWDTEIKRAQVDGLEGYPVYTRKIVSYRVREEAARGAGRRTRSSRRRTRWPRSTSSRARTTTRQYEFQCLHGMGEPLYERSPAATS